MTNTRPGKNCSVCDNTKCPMLLLNETYVCLACAKRLGLLAKDDEQPIGGR